MSSPSYRDLIKDPIFAVSTPRSGSTLLFETLAKARGLFTPGGESHSRIEKVANFHPAARNWTSNRLTQDDATNSNVEQLAELFYRDLREAEGELPEGAVRMLEKTPKNSLRIPFFSAAWPSATFVYLYRDPRATLASMAEAWATGRFTTYPQLPGWTGLPWSLLLVPGWRDLIGKPLMEVVAAQWARTTEIILDDLANQSNVVAIAYDDLIADPNGLLSRLTSRLGIDWDVRLPDELPYSKMTYSKPSAEKWRRLEDKISAVLPIVAAADERARRFSDEVGLRV
ncbi:sulfotransferase [Sphingomonas piscis]|uniref:Sulfotransferase n=1 Tax=Sphingomonas piscis TaxID=2714943 RepID=A0A6G7YN38_9SPHN|nr:sulfotransferase [Sphingomonas piscis]QIK78152.1 sulfotransferase [Sphingomonas piscis]